MPQKKRGGEETCSVPFVVITVGVYGLPFIVPLMDPKKKIRFLNKCLSNNHQNYYLCVSRKRVINRWKEVWLYVYLDCPCLCYEGAIKGRISLQGVQRTAGIYHVTGTGEEIGSLKRTGNSV